MACRFLLRRKSPLHATIRAAGQFVVPGSTFRRDEAPAIGAGCDRWGGVAGAGGAGGGDLGIAPRCLPGSTQAPRSQQRAMGMLGCAIAMEGPPAEDLAAIKEGGKAIMQILTGFMPSRVLQVAVGMGLFTALGDRSMTAQQLGEALGIHPQARYDFFDTLVALKLLDREGDGVEGRYRNTLATAVLLVKGSPQYSGGLAELANTQVYRDWNNLETGLKTGERQRGKGDSILDQLRSIDNDPKFFLNVMDTAHRQHFEEFVAEFDPKGYRSVADVGCGSALLSVVMAKRHPHLTFHPFDQPSVTPETQQRVDAAGLTDRFKVHTGDFFVNDLPKADVVIMAHTLHNWNEEQKMVLIRKAYDALPEGGAFVVIEAIIDDVRRENTLGLLISLMMLMECGSSGSTGADIRRRCGEVGFKTFDTIHRGGPYSALVAYK